MNQTETARFHKLQNTVYDNEEWFNSLKVNDVEWFLDWLWSNLSIYNEFERYAKELFHNGKREHYSARAISQRLRWDTLFSEKDSEYKINNNAVAYMARLVVSANPDLKGMFKTRQRQEDDSTDR